MKAKIKTIDIQAKEWFDKLNGNSYFSARVTINFGLKGQQTLYLPFQYGYGSHCDDMAMEAIRDNINKKIVKESKTNYDLRHKLRETGAIIRSTKQEDCLKRDVIAWGEKS